MVPVFTLPSVAGGVSGPGTLRSKYNMVLVFVGMGSDAWEYLRSVVRVYPDISSEQARVIAVAVGDRQGVQQLATELALPFAVLADSDGKLTRRLLGGEGGAALCVADRYGEVYFLQIAPDAPSLPDPQTAVDWLEFIGIQRVTVAA